MNRQQRRREQLLGRKQRRRLKQLLDQDELAGIGSIDDATFFKEHPGMRLATPGEVETAEFIRWQRLYDRRFHWTVVRQIAPGIRVRLGMIAPLPDGYPVHDIPEHVAREFFEDLAELPTEPSVSEISKQLRNLKVTKS